MGQQVRSTFFNAVWLYGAVALLFLGMALRQPALSILACLTLVTAVGSRLWNRHCLDNIEYTRQLSATRVFRGETIDVTTRIVNRKWLPLPWLEVEDQIADRLRLLDRDTLPSSTPGTAIVRTTTSLRWFERVSWTVHIECPHRGAYRLGPVTLRSGDLFGFFSRRGRIDHLDQVIVYPRIVPVDRLGLPPRHPFGEARAPHQVITDPLRPVGIRDYRPEDSFRFIHWKATAKLQEVQVKVFEPTVSVQLGIFLNLDTYERYWEGIDYERAESAIVAAASLAAYGLDQRYLVGIFANGVVSGSDQTLRIRPGRGPDQMAAILQGLAKLTPLSAASFPRLLREEARRFPWGSTTVVVTSLMTPPLVSALAELLDAGHRVVLLRVGDVEVPPLQGLVVHTLPRDLVNEAVGEAHRYAVIVDVRSAGVAR